MSFQGNSMFGVRAERHQRAIFAPQSCLADSGQNVDVLSRHDERLPERRELGGVTCRQRASRWPHATLLGRQGLIRGMCAQAPPFEVNAA